MKKNTYSLGLQGYHQFLRRKRISLLLLLVATVASAVYSIGVGSIQISILDVFRVLSGGGEKCTVQSYGISAFPGLLPPSL